MSLIPLLYRDWWDDFDRPSRLFDQNFGLGLRREDLLSSLSSAFPRSGYLRPWRDLGRQNSGISTVQTDKDKFQVILDVQQFGPSEITIKTVNRNIVVEGKHEEKQDEHGFISRHFVRKYLLPQDSEAAQVTSTLSSDGILTITAPRKVAETNEERMIPITPTGPARPPPAVEAPQPNPKGPETVQIPVQQEK